MSKTGGGLGSNQHKIRGTGITSPQSKKHAESDVPLDIFVTQYGETPIDLDAAEFLTREFMHLETLNALNEAEVLNIADASMWLEEQTLAPGDILNQTFLRELHRRMLCDVWTWAGKIRLRETNLGVDPAYIQERWQSLLGDVLYWIENETFPVEEICVRLHHKMVEIHPFTNGNGRHARLTANALAESLGKPADLFTWGRRTVFDNEVGRQQYLAALRKADNGSYDDLVMVALS